MTEHSQEDSKLEPTFDELMATEEYQGADDILGLKKRVREARKPKRGSKERKPDTAPEIRTDAQQTDATESEPTLDFDFTRLAAEDEELYISDEDKERRALESRILEKLPQLEALSGALDAFIKARIAFQASEEETGPKAQRAYMISRNDLLFDAIRSFEEDRPEEKGELIQWEMAREAYLDSLYDTFIKREGEEIQESNDSFDAVEGLLIDPFLVTIFASRIQESYRGEAQRVFNRLREPSFDVLKGIYAHSAFRREADRRMREFNESRLDYHTAYFASLLGYKEKDLGGKRRSYYRRKDELFTLMKRIGREKNAEGDWLDKTLKRLLVPDQVLENSMRAYVLPEEKRLRLSTVGGAVRKMFGTRAFRYAAVLGLLGSATFADTLQETNRLPERPAYEEVVKPPPTYEKPIPQEAPVVMSIRGEVTGARGAIGALDQLAEQAVEHNFGWLQTWMGSVVEGARPDLVRTRDGQLEMIAQELGFLSYMPTFDDANPYDAYSARLPEGSRLEADNAGVYLVYQDGRRRPLVMRHRGASDPTVIGFGSEEGDRYDKER